MIFFKIDDFWTENFNTYFISGGNDSLSTFTLEWILEGHEREGV